MAGKARKRKKGSKNQKKIKTYVGITVFSFLLLLIILMMVSNHLKKKQVQEVVLIEKSVEDGIKEAADLLGVPDRLYTKRVRNGEIHISMNLNRDRLDLNFANMILSGKIESYGGKIISGEENRRGTSHTIRIEEGENIYLVTLAYDTRGTYPAKKPQLAIIVDDFGEISGELLDGFLASHPAVTFSILPGLRNSRLTMDKAVESGREVMLHIPMEPLGYPRNNPGKNAILVEHTDREIKRLMDGYLRELPLVLGANNHMGSLATADERVMTAVLKSLQENDLYFVDSRTTADSRGWDLAQRMMIPSIKRDLFLDAPQNTEAIMKERLKDLQKLKDKQDKVVLITHCSDKKRLELMNKFIEEAEKLGFEIVPVSQLFKSDVPEIM